VFVNIVVALPPLIFHSIRLNLYLLPLIRHGWHCFCPCNDLDAG